jgi:hypothetical protein
VAWASYTSSPDDSRSVRRVEVDEADRTCHFCGRDFGDVEFLEARPIIRRWTSNEKTDQGEQLVCSVCVGRVAAHALGRRCDLCMIEVVEREFIVLGMAGTVCFDCEAQMNHVAATWAEAAGEECVNCGAELSGKSAWRHPTARRLLCRGCSPPRGLFGSN